MPPQDDVMTAGAAMEQLPGYKDARERAHEERKRLEAELQKDESHTPVVAPNEPASRWPDRLGRHTPDGPTLVTKLAEVMGTIENVAKRGTNPQHGYQYAMAADVYAAVRKELAARHVMIVPEIVGKSETQKTNVLITELTLEFTIIDGESGEALTRRWIGSGMDTQEKGVYKALTGGLKNFILDLFLVSTGDDPEADGEAKASGGSRGRGKAQERRSQPKPQSNEEKPAGAQGGSQPQETALWQEYEALLARGAAEANVDIEDFRRDNVKPWCRENGHSYPPNKRWGDEKLGQVVEFLRSGLDPEPADQPA
jgi:hypothetical protein